MIVDLLIATIILPGLVAGGLVLATARPWRYRDHQTQAPAGGAALSRKIPSPWAAVAVGAGYLAGHVAILGSPELVPVRATGWLFHIALLATAVAVIESTAAKVWLGWLLRTIIAFAAAWALLRAPIDNRWSFGSGLLWVAGVAIGMMTIWRFFDQATARRDSRFATLLLLVFAAAGANVLILSGTLLVGQLGGGLAASIGALLLVALVFPRNLDIRSAIPVTAAVSWSALVIGFLFAEMPVAAAVLMWATPLLLVLSDRVVIEALRNRLQPVLRLVVLLLPLAGAVGTAAHSYFAEPAPTASGDDYSYGYEYSE